MVRFPLSFSLVMALTLVLATGCGGSADNQQLTLVNENGETVAVYVNGESDAGRENAGSAPGESDAAAGTTGPGGGTTGDPGIPTRRRPIDLLMENPADLEGEALEAAERSAPATAVHGDAAAP